MRLSEFVRLEQSPQPVDLRAQVLPRGPLVDARRQVRCLHERRGGPGSPQAVTVDLGEGSVGQVELAGVEVGDRRPGEGGGLLIGQLFGEVVGAGGELVRQEAPRAEVGVVLVVGEMAAEVAWSSVERSSGQHRSQRFRTEAVNTKEKNLPNAGGRLHQSL